MASSDPGRRVQQSVLDRLVDRDPRGRTGGVEEWGTSVAAYRHSVLRDLEQLLNTRRTPRPVPEGLELVRSSVFRYGLPDLSSLSADSTDDRRLLLREVQETLRAYEPRLAEVRVSAAGTDDPSRSSRPEIRLVVRGLLLMEPEPEQVSFDTVLELSSGHVAVEGEG